MPFQPGILLKNRYRLRALVGDGGFSLVYRAYDNKLRRRVAVKAFDPPPGGAADDARRRFLAEARKLASINSPHVVTIHDRGSSAKVPYFVMEYLPYSVHDLLADLDGESCPYEDAARILRQTLTGLRVVHHRGWTHRDVKPANILLTGDDDAKLADFGLIKDPRVRRTRPGAIPGTAGWMAPEQEAGNAATPRSDVYAFGLVAHRLLTGRSWHDSAGGLSPPLDASLAAVLTRCVAPDPTDRPDTGTVLEAWETFDRRRRERPRRRVRGDARVDTVSARIESHFGLPEGSVALRYPDNTPLRRNVRISRLRLIWDS